MARFNLVKDQRFNLTKNAPGMKNLRVELGWKPPVGVKADIDVSMFGLYTKPDGNPSLVCDDYFVFFGHHSREDKVAKGLAKYIVTDDGAVQYLGDDRGSTNGTKSTETMILSVDLINSAVMENSFIVTIDSPAGMTFGQIGDAYIKLIDDDTNVELAQYDLDEQFTNETAVQFGSLFRTSAGWEFKAIGAGFKNTLGDFVDMYTV